jgi:hypothetical protein
MKLSMKAACDRTYAIPIYKKELLFRLLLPHRAKDILGACKEFGCDPRLRRGGVFFDLLGP